MLVTLNGSIARIDQSIARVGAPKRVVCDAHGEIIGVEAVGDQESQASETSPDLPDPHLGRTTSAA